MLFFIADNSVYPYYQNMRLIYYAWTFQEGFAGIYHSGPRSRVDPEELFWNGLPFLADRNEPHGAPAFGEMRKYAFAISEGAFAELCDLKEICLSANDENHLAVADIINEIIDASPWSKPRETAAPRM